MKHLTLPERAVIAHLHAQGKSVREIGRQLGRSHTTIMRELDRNGSKTTSYKPETAQRRYRTRLRKRQQARRKVKEDELDGFCHVLDSTLLTVGQASRMLQGSRFSLGRSRMYALIREDKLRGGSLWHSLIFSQPVARKYPAKSGKAVWDAARKRIEQRPEIVDLLTEYGHWEADTVHSKGHRGGVLTLVERMTLRVRASIIPDLKAQTVSAGIARLLDGEVVRTITSDNGSEFAGWRDVEAATGCGFYFARPYRSNDRSRNERMNREIRRFFPKGTDFGGVDEAWFSHVVDRINSVPREKFGWINSNQMVERLVA